MEARRTASVAMARTSVTPMLRPILIIALSADDGLLGGLRVERACRLEASAESGHRALVVDDAVRSTDGHLDHDRAHGVRADVDGLKESHELILAESVLEGKRSGLRSVAFTARRPHKCR